MINLIHTSDNFTRIFNAGIRNYCRMRATFQLLTHLLKLSVDCSSEFCICGIFPSYPPLPTRVFVCIFQMFFNFIIFDSFFFFHWRVMSQRNGGLSHRNKK